MSLLSSLFATKRPQDFLSIFELPARTSCFFRDPDEAMAYALGRKGADVYFGLGLLARNHGSGHRGKAKHVIAITCLWADIDIAGVGHERQDLPPSREAVDEVLRALPLPPTHVVFSGGGYHMYWRLTEAMRCEDDTSRGMAESMLRKWQTLLRIHFAAKGWTMDSTYDLARVLRVPGTINHKEGLERPVELVSECETTYTIDEVIGVLDTYADQIAAMDSGPLAASGQAHDRPIDYSTFRLDQQAQPPQPKWDILQDIEPKARDSWNHLRPELKDQTCSGYDLSLATLCAGMFADDGSDGWSDQEIVDLLVAHRRRYKGKVDEKGEYFARTIRQARESAAKHRAGTFIASFPVAQADASEEELADIKMKARVHLGETLGVTIVKVIRYVADPMSYRLVLDNGSIALPKVSDLIEQTPFRHAIAQTTGRYLSPVKQTVWHGIAQALLNLCEDEDVGVEATDDGAIGNWLQGYFRDRVPVQDILEGMELGAPFVHTDRKLYLSGESFRQWLIVHRNERLSAKQLGPLLRNVGCLPKALNAFINGRKTSYFVWQIPDRFTLGVADESEESDDHER